MTIGSMIGIKDFPSEKKMIYNKYHPTYSMIVISSDSPYRD